MIFDQPITRRQSIKKLVKLSGGLAMAGALTWPFQKTSLVNAASENKKFIIEGLGQAEAYSIKELTRKVFDAAGGISRFVSKGDIAE